MCIQQAAINVWESHPSIHFYISIHLNSVNDRKKALTSCKHLLDGSNIQNKKHLRSSVHQSTPLLVWTPMSFKWRHDSSELYGSC